MADRKAVMLNVCIALIVFLLMLLTGGGLYLWLSSTNQKNVDALNKRIAALETRLKATGKTTGGQSGKTTATKDPYESWLTYENLTVNYTLRYPADWTFTEATSIDTGPVDVVDFYSPNKTYMLEFGLRKSGSDIGISTRTGLGQGESVAAGSVTILGESVAKTYHVNNGKAAILFYGTGNSANFAVGDFEIHAELSAPGLNYDSTDVKGIPEEGLADKVVASLKMK